jgi:NAD(P)-dependent dehydrogenase (short-subunit alcohol dehydrogenase family)
VNAICPGLIETGMTDHVFNIARARRTAHKISKRVAAARSGVADEIARAALFLASDEASYVNGQSVVVDGGLSATFPRVLGKIVV